MFVVVPVKSKQTLNYNIKVCLALALNAIYILLILDYLSFKVNR